MILVREVFDTKKLITRFIGFTLLFLLLLLVLGVLIYTIIDFINIVFRSNILSPSIIFGYTKNFLIALNFILIPIIVVLFDYLDKPKNYFKQQEFKLKNKNKK